MSYERLAYLTIRSSPPNEVGSGAPITYGVGLYRKDYTGPQYTIEHGTDTPLSTEAHNEDDNLFSPIITQELTIGLFIDSGYDETLFSVIGDYDLKVEVDELTETGAIAKRVFRGWVDAPDLQVEYMPKPYPLTLKVVCGLSMLKSRPMLGTDGKLPSAAMTLREALNAALNSATRLDLPLCTIDNLEEAYARRVTTINSELDMTVQLRLGADYFTTGGENGNPPTAKKIVADICNGLNATIMQHNAAWWLVRTPEKGGGWMPPRFPRSTLSDGRVFARMLDYDGTNPRVEVLDLCYPVSIAGSGRVLTGATLTTQPPKATYSVKQNFGVSLNRFVNSNFKTMSPGNTLPDGWLREGGSEQTTYRLGSGSIADPYRIRITGSSSNTVTIKSGQPYLLGFRQLVAFVLPNGQPSKELFDPFATPPRNQPMRLTGQFRGNNIRGAKIFVLANLNPRFSSQAGGDWMILDSDGQWKIFVTGNVQALPIDGTITTGTNKRVTKPGWIDIDVSIPAPGPFYLWKMYVMYGQGDELLQYPDTNRPDRLAPYPDDAWIEYREGLKITVGDPDKAITGQVFTVTNFTLTDPDVAVVTPEVDLEINWGDVPPVIADGPELSGMLRTSVFTGQFPPAGRFNRPTVPSDDFFSALFTYDRPLAHNCALERAAQLSKPARLLEGELAGNLPHGPLTLLQVMDLFSPLGAPALFSLIGWEWDQRRHVTKITARELLDFPGQPQKILAEWDTPNGRYPQEVQPLADFVIDPLIHLDPLPVVPKKPVGKYTPAELGQLASGTKEGFDLNADGTVKPPALTPTQKRAAGPLLLERNGHTIDQIYPVGIPLLDFIDPNANG